MKKYKLYIIIGICILGIGVFLNHSSNTYEEAMSETARVFEEHEEVTDRLDEANRKLEEARQKLKDTLNKL